MDDYIRKLAAAYGRVPETAWWLDYRGTAAELRDQVKTILGQEDLLLVIEAKSAAWAGLLIDADSLVTAWHKAA